MFKLQLMTADNYKKEGFKYQVNYAFHQTQFGKSLIGILDNKEKSICHLSFVNKSETTSLESLKKQWPKNELLENLKETTKYIEIIFSENFKGLEENNENDEDSNFEDVINIILKGTEFQIKVWTQLIEIPCGSTTTYEKVAQAIENPKAVRAVANAIAGNLVAYLIPCHRVMSKNGANKYAFGVECKLKILNYEKEITN
ncbi:bifunctional transcriptional activator/DNA repair enzyme Ada [Leptopilina heterotoma]|uniref:bifunctional transcriptional activator/DNA repair enzyme Ada n=1 Tax=Leptopilina heterotoma TaxID=63436 RepID=UPI001CAA2069|nr:bifunctional transcriptional activator/DNA repair enzyme Ada [Leptopilina heterotoma]